MEDEDWFKFHICTESPCPEQDRAYFELLTNGFTTTFTEEK